MEKSIGQNLAVWLVLLLGLSQADALQARQISARGGVLRCRDRGDRVDIGGPARLYLEGRISL